MMKNLKCPQCNTYSFIKGTFLEFIGQKGWKCKKCRTSLTFSPARSKLIITIWAGLSLPAIWGLLCLPYVFKVLIILFYSSYPLFSKVEEQTVKQINICSNGSSGKLL